MNKDRKQHELAGLSGFYADESSDILPSFEDRTEFVLNILLNLGIIIDNGMLYQDEDEPETVFVRSLSVVLTDKT